MKFTRYYILVKGGSRKVTRDRRMADALTAPGWSMTHEDFYG